MKNYESHGKSRNDIYKIAGALALTTGIFGYYIGEHNQSANNATNEATIGIPNFHNESAQQFISKSPQIKKEIQEGRLVVVSADPFPLKDRSMLTPNTIDSIAWDITPKSGDFNTVASTLAVNQNNGNSTIGTTQEFIVNATPQAVQLALDEKQLS